MKNKVVSGHLLSLFTVIVWGMTFISTKKLLGSFEPTEILFMRFIIGFAALFIMSPKIVRYCGIKREITFALAGICGVSLYFLCENIALTMTLASSVSVIVSTAPFFTAIVSRIFLKDSDEKPYANFFIGFVISIIGICFITLNGVILRINPVGDILSVVAAVVWAFYSVLVKKISAYGLSTIQSTRRVFGYGLVFMLPAMFFLDFSPQLSKLASPANLLNLLFLGLIASALCFVTWNVSIKFIGTLKTSVYIYLIPVITVIASIIFLNEKLTPALVAGTLLTLAGLVISELRFGK